MIQYVVGCTSGNLNESNLVARVISESPNGGAGVNVEMILLRDKTQTLLR